jgi:hypothetical protein
MALRLLVVALGFACATAPAFAWVYPEHRDIAVLGIESLDVQRQAVFDQLWAEARIGYEQRLCKQGADTAQGLMPDCIDWAAMSAIAGDHSCSSTQLFDTVSTSEWIMAVAEVAAQLKVDLTRISKTSPGASQEEGRSLIGDLRRQIESEAIRADRINVLRIADIRLQRADPEYATRAGSNNAHFLLARPRVDFTAPEYVETTLTVGSEINAVGAWGRFHLSALQKATRLARESLSPEERTALARAVLADEAFALHFMEDVFAAGHVAGTWGDVSQRKGTHDYYNESGLEVRTWQPGANTAVLMGDAHMRPEDAQRAAEAVRLSLEQVLDTAAGRPRATDLPYTPAAPGEPEAFDVCSTDRLGPWSQGREPTLEAVELGVEVLLLTPVPSLGEGLGAMPRFRSELGPFIGVAGSLDVRSLDGAFTDVASGSGFVGGAARRRPDCCDSSTHWPYGPNTHAVLSDTRRPAAPVAAVPRIAQDLSKHGGHCGKWRTDPLAARLGNSIRPISARAGTRNRGDLPRARLGGRNSAGAGRSSGFGAEGGRVRVDVSRIPDARVPSVSVVRHDAELGVDSATIRRRGHTERGECDLSARRAACGPGSRVLDRSTTHLRLAPLLLSLPANSRARLLRSARRR